MPGVAKAAGVRAGGATNYWTVSPQWRGETVFVIAGGPSVAGQDVDRLRGRKVIVINSSLYRAPWADLLFFADSRWWRKHQAAVAAFAGRAVHATTFAAGGCGDKVLYLHKRMPPGLSTDRSEVTCRRTSLTGIFNALAHFGGRRRVVLLGVDGGPDASGRTHHHERHPWDPVTGIWDQQRDELATVVDDLAALGIEILNASPVSTLPFWPRVSFEEICSCS